MARVSYVLLLAVPVLLLPLVLPMPPGGELLVLPVVAALLFLLVRHARKARIGGRDVGGALVFSFLASFVLLVLGAAFRGDKRLPARESAAIGDVRAMISAQGAYAGANGGFFDRPECLAAPRDCRAALPENMPTFLDPTLARTTVERGGYRRVFHPGPAAAAEEIEKAGASRSSLLRWAYAAEPLVPGRTGVRSFCGDSTGRVCGTSGEAPLKVTDARCPAECRSFE